MDFKDLFARWIGLQDTNNPIEAEILTTDDLYPPEYESKGWIITCPSCNSELSVPHLEPGQAVTVKCTICERVFAILLPSLWVEHIKEALDGYLSPEKIGASNAKN